MEYIDKEDRPWGCFYVIHEESSYKLKRIEVNPTHKLSYQYHKKRSETWVIINGSGVVTINGKEKEVCVGDTVIIAKEAKHRIENTSKEKLIFLEVQTGEYFGEDDITRINDDYGRK